MIGTISVSLMLVDCCELGLKVLHLAVYIVFLDSIVFGLFYWCY